VLAVIEWLVYRDCAAADLLKRSSTLEPTPRRNGFELGTYWRAEPGTKGMLPYGTLGVLAAVIEWLVYLACAVDCRRAHTMQHT
jgi:hypothetical protein